MTRAHPHNLITFQRPGLQIPARGGLVSTCEFGGGGAHIQFIASSTPPFLVYQYVRSLLPLGSVVFIPLVQLSAETHTKMWFPQVC